MDTHQGHFDHIQSSVTDEFLPRCWLQDPWPETWSAERSVQVCCWRDSNGTNRKLGSAWGPTNLTGRMIRITRDPSLSFDWAIRFKEAENAKSKWGARENQGGFQPQWLNVAKLWTWCWYNIIQLLCVSIRQCQVGPSWAANNGPVRICQQRCPQHGTSTQVSTQSRLRLLRLPPFKVLLLTQWEVGKSSDLQPREAPNHRYKSWDDPGWGPVASFESKNHYDYDFMQVALIKDQHLIIVMDLFDCICCRRRYCANVALLLATPARRKTTMQPSSFATELQAFEWFRPRGWRHLHQSVRVPLLLEFCTFSENCCITSLYKRPCLFPDSLRFKPILSTLLPPSKIQWQEATTPWRWQTKAKNTMSWLTQSCVFWLGWVSMCPIYQVMDLVRMLYLLRIQVCHSNQKQRKHPNAQRIGSKSLSAHFLLIVFATLNNFSFKCHCPREKLFKHKSFSQDLFSASFVPVPVPPEWYYLKLFTLTLSMCSKGFREPHPTKQQSNTSWPCNSRTVELQ